MLNTNPLFAGLMIFICIIGMLVSLLTPEEEMLPPGNAFWFLANLASVFFWIFYA